MRKSRTGLFIVLGIVAVIAIWLISSYNSLVNLESSVDSQFATVESKLQRRYDLIPNLVNSVKGSMSHEEKVFKDIADARSKLAGATSADDKVEASNNLEGALSRLLVVVENYPDLKASQQVKDLMTELSGTENRISVERDRYNETIKKYNVKVKRFPTNIMAGIFGFENKPYFEATEGANVAPKVDLTS